MGLGFGLTVGLIDGLEEDEPAGEKEEGKGVLVGN